MLLLIVFSFLAGLVTILSPCILPLLPIILSSSLTGSKRRPLGIVLGFILSFTFFTLFLTTIVSLTGIPSDSLRTFSIVIIFIFGLVLVVPRLQLLFESIASKIASKAGAIRNRHKDSGASTGFFSGIIVGVSIGLLWTPCVGPILASVISLALTCSVTVTAFFIILAYSIGTAIPMLAIIYGGRSLIHRVPFLLKNLANIQKVFGLVMIFTALAIAFNYDRQFQSYVLEKLPKYGTGLTKIEDNEIVKERLKEMDMAPFVNESNLAPEIIQGGEWFNSKPLKLSDLYGKVVLIDFWTYSCINCIRTLPYLQSWHEKYRNQGLVIIGVHTPEFEFEKKPENLARAIKDFGLTYPIVQDNDYKTWRAYFNRYWPAKYLIDGNGKVVWHHFGEGDYDETEKQIQAQLSKAGWPVRGKIENPKYRIFSRTSEIYLGYGRLANIDPSQQITKNNLALYQLPDSLPEDNFAFGGQWKITREKAAPRKDASLKLNFDSKDLFIVLNPLNGETGKLEVLLDGKLITDFAGKDVHDGIVTIDTDRLYELVKLDKPGRHDLELKFLDSNVEAYAFTFG